MSLAPYDSKKHHIGLGPATTTDSYGFLVAGAYSKGFRRILQSDFLGVHYGSGESLVNVPGLSSWSQDDFTGGVFQYVWGKDPAQFARSLNIIPSQFDRSIRSVPPMQQWLGGKRRVTTEVPFLVTVYGGYLIAVYRDRFSRWALTDGTYSEDVIDGGVVGGDILRSCVLRDMGRIFKSKNQTVSRYNLATFSGWEGTFALPTGAVGNVTGLDASGDKLVIAYQDVLWVVKLNDTRTSNPKDPAFGDASSDFTRIGRLPGSWTASVWYSGLLYILLSGQDAQTQLVVFDGTTVLPITDFPYNFVGESICVYGGRVYVGGSGRDIQTGAAQYAELYEVTGASLRLIKTFSPERRGAGDVVGKSIYSMIVHEGLLLFGVKGIGLIAYDLTTDSFYGASGFAPADATSECRWLVSGRESLFSFVYPIALNTGEGGWFRPATAQETVATYSSEIETSDFATSIDRKKKWKQLRAQVRFPIASLSAQYSIDGGATWSSTIYPVSETNGRFQLETFDLSAAPAARQIRFKFFMPSSTNVAAFREFTSFTASFRMLDSDVVSTGQKEKLAWIITVGGMDRIEAADGTSLTQDLYAMRDQLWEWAEDRTQLGFRDLDGRRIIVEIDSLDETQPVVLPGVDYYEPETPGLTSNTNAREAYYKLTLVEV